MNQDMNQREIFLQALEKPAESDRREFLDVACAGNGELRSRVEELLHAQEKVDRFLETPPPGLSLAIPTDPPSQFQDSLADVSLDFLSRSDKPGCLGTIASYEIVGLIGRGAFGLVFRAFDPKLNRIVAVKVMAPEWASNEIAVKRFLREAQAAAAVRHDNVITIHAIEESHSPPFIVMEYIEGESLKECVQRDGQMDLAEILRIGMQIATGLSAAHAQGLVHRDVKPANILLENGIRRVKITDFGLARAVDDTGMTQSGTIAGTPRYMSPEQCLGNSIDARSDLFSLGSVLYTLCTGRAAFSADTAVATLRQVCDEQPERIRDINPDIPEWFERIVMRLLEKSPNRRIQTADEVSNLLAECLSHVQSTGQVTPPPSLSSVATVSLPTQASPAYAALVKLHLLTMIGSLIAAFVDIESIIFTLPVFFLAMGLIIAVFAKIKRLGWSSMAFGLSSIGLAALVVLVINLFGLGTRDVAPVWGLMSFYVVAAVPWGINECKRHGPPARILSRQFWQNRHTYLTIFAFQLIGVASATVAAQLESESVPASGVFQGLVFGSLLAVLSVVVGRRSESRLFALMVPVFCVVGAFIIVQADLSMTNTWGESEQMIGKTILAFALLALPVGLIGFARELNVFPDFRFDLRIALVAVAMAAVAFAGAQPCIAFGGAAYIAGVLFVLTLLSVAGLLGWSIYKRQGNFQPYQWIGLCLGALFVQLSFMTLVVWYSYELNPGYLLVHSKTPVTIQAIHLPTGQKYTLQSDGEPEAFLSGLHGEVELKVVGRNDLKVKPSRTSLHRFTSVEVEVVTDRDMMRE